MAQPDSPFQTCMKALETVARGMWEKGVEGKTLQQSDYLWPMADALQAYEKAIKEAIEATKVKVSTPEQWERASSSYDPELSRVFGVRKGVDDGPA